MPHRFTALEIARMRGSAAYRRGRTQQDAVRLAIDKGYPVGSPGHAAFVEGFQSRLDAENPSTPPSSPAGKGNTSGSAGNASA